MPIQFLCRKQWACCLHQADVLRLPPASILQDLLTSGFLLTSKVKLSSECAYAAVCL